MATRPTFDLDDLDGRNGFRIDGIDTLDRLGASVSGAGDLNGDGLGDLVVGLPGGDAGGTNSGESYVLFGRAGGFPVAVGAGAFNGRDGFRLVGVDGGDLAGASVSGAGDLNGDGLDDLVVGAPFADADGDGEAGESYVVFGRGGRFPASLDLGALDGRNGFRLDGGGAGDRAGTSVAGAGDLNGDGFDDLVVGAPFASEAYVVFGGGGGFPASLDLDALDGRNGFRIDGISGEFGFSVAGLGDLNGDGFDDLAVGAPTGDVTGRTDAGTSTILYGRAGGFAASFDVQAINGVNGFRLFGANAGDRSGFSVSGAGDLNGDGLADLIVGARGADPDGRSSAGESYVVFGRTGGFPANADIRTLDGAVGFRMDGVSRGDQAGFSVSAAGDVNGDGFDDLVVGAPDADPGGRAEAGASYVVYGRAAGFAPIVELSRLDGRDGFRLEGRAPNGSSGVAVSGAGDLDGDGLADLIVGAERADPGGRLDAGEAYVVFGALPAEAVTRVGSEIGQTIRGGAFADALFGRGGADLLVGNGGDDLLEGGAGADVLLGGAGSDTASYRGSAEGVRVELDRERGRNGDAAGDRLTGIENLVGSGENDTLTGDDGVNRLEGGPGNDTIFGLEGADRIVGGSGADRIEGGSGSDRIDTGSGADRIGGGRGKDTISAGSGADRVLGEQSADTILAMSGNDFIEAGSGADVVEAGSGNDRVFGGSGGDIIEGGSGGDRIVAGSGSDVIESGSGNDVIEGNSGRDRILAGSGNDQIRGGSDNDRIDAGSGDDLIIGGGDDDRLTGGGGADEFRFGAGDGSDVITDFADDVDRIRISGFGRDREAVLDRARQAGDDVVFDLGDGDRLRVEDISLGALLDDVLLG
jgi:Ca2+-binding RTX toxin-like protein